MSSTTPAFGIGCGRVAIIVAVVGILVVGGLAFGIFSMAKNLTKDIPGVASITSGFAMPVLTFGSQGIGPGMFSDTRSVAADDGGPVGTRIGLFSDALLEFPAGTSFNIRHGWVQTSDDGAIGIFDFRLEVDGVFVNNVVRMFSEESGDPDILTRLFVYNFPDGMTGVHTFTGHWYAPCQYAVDWLGHAGSCATPNEKVETNSRTRVVTFVP